jgi:apolipoprotein N-acyltransferase
VRGQQLLIASVPAAVSAVLYGLTFPPYGLTALAWCALAPLMLALRRGGAGQALFVAWLWCVVDAWVVGDWFPRAVAAYFQQSLALALALFVGVFTLMAAPYVMAFALAYRALSRRFHASLPFLAAAAWVAAELGRGRLFTGSPFFIGNPWALAGYAHADHLALVQIASVTGIYGVSFAVACVNAALAELWCLWRRAARPSPRRLAALGACVLPALAILAYGHAALRRAAQRETDAPAIRVAIAQGNLDLGARWRADAYGRNLDLYLGLTREAGAERPDIVFWPEAAMTFFVEDEPLYRRVLGSVLRGVGAELVAGGVRAVRAEEPLYYNSVYVLGEDGEVRGRYDKEYLLPFSEYFPLRIDVLKRRFGRIRAFQHGEVVGPVPTRAGPAGVLVCNEAMLPEVAAARVARGAVYLVNPTNDSWITDPQYTQQQFDIATLRAIEQRRYLVRVSTAGPSAVIDPWGRTRAVTRPLTRSVVVGEIRPRRERSLYGRVGDLFAGACVVVAAAALLAPRRRPQGPAGAAPATR